MACYTDNRVRRGRGQGGAAGTYGGAGATGAYGGAGATGAYDDAGGREDGLAVAAAAGASEKR